MYSPTMWFTLIGVTVVEPLKLVEGGGSSGGGGVADDAVDARLNRVDASDPGAPYVLYLSDISTPGPLPCT